jgi:thiamine kinase-like enzyme
MEALVEPGVEDRIAALGCWTGPVVIEPLKGGISNESYLVTDGRGRHVARFGKDYPFHHVSREREVMTATAAFEAGFGPRVEYAAPGVMVSAFVLAKTFEAADVRANCRRVAQLLGRFHQTMPSHVSGAGFMFWPFHVIRDYARTLASGGSRLKDALPHYLALARALEEEQSPLPIVFGHNDLLPANILDDGERLWLIDFEYAGFSTAMFDLAGTTSNAGFEAEEVDEFLTSYFGFAPTAEIRRAHSAMQCASLLREAMWSLASELYLAAPGADYAGYTTENLVRLDAALERHQSTYGKL